MTVFVGNKGRADAGIGETGNIWPNGARTSRLTRYNSTYTPGWNL